MSDAVADLLTSKGLKFMPSGHDYLIKCLNPEHVDSNPSCRIDKVTGACHCFSCGFKTNIFKYFGVLTNPLPGRMLKLKEKLAAVKAATTGLDLPDGAIPYTRPFRNISVKTLKHVGAFYTNKVAALEDRIVFPITDIRGKIQVFVARHILSNGNPRYVNYPKGVEIPLFPPAAPKSAKYIILVEGITDYLNVYDKGLHNCVCTFGTNTLQKDTKAKMLPFRAQGINKIYIMFDSDEAGRKAAELIKPLLEELEFSVEIIQLEDNMDPGELDQTSVDSIREYCEALEKDKLDTSH